MCHCVDAGGGASARRLYRLLLEKFKQDYISEGGRVIDPSDTRKITTSEGQSYALFFALAANDRKAFDKVLAWTRDNLAGDISTTRSPPGYGGKRQRHLGGYRYQFRLRCRYLDRLVPA